MAKKRGAVSLTRRTDKTVSAGPDTKETSSQVHKSTSVQKERITVYAHPDTLLRLETARVKIKQLINAKGYLVSGSNVVEIALKRVLDEFEASPEASVLLQTIAVQKQEQERQRQEKQIANAERRT